MFKGGPVGWLRVKFGDVVRLVSDRCDPVAAGIERYVGLEHIEPEDLRVRHWGQVADGTTFTNRFRPGHVLFGKRRAYQKKVAIADFEGVCSGDIYVMESADPRRLLPELLPFLCETQAFFEHAVGTSAGSLSPRTNWASLADFEFSLPPPPIQADIVAQLLAVRVTTESYGSLEDAYSGVRAALELELFSEASIEGSTSRPLADFCSRIGVGIATSVAHAYRKQGVPIIRNTNINPGWIDTSDLLFIDPAFDEQQRTKRVRAGDLVITRTATDMPGEAAVVPECLNGAQTFTTLICTPKPDVADSDFLCAWINGAPGQSFIRSRKAGGIQQNLNATLLEALPVQAPSLRRQKEIASVIVEARRRATLIAERGARVVQHAKAFSQALLGG